jgi:hypothetical protein
MPATRRRLLATAGLAAWPADRSVAGDSLAVLGYRLRRLLSGANSAHHIAAAYLAGIAETDYRRAAVDLGMPAILAPTDRIVGMDGLRAFLGSRIRADFATGAVIDVDGWRLSRTEVGACLLAASVT